MRTQIEKLDAAGYRKFGLTTGLIVAGLFGLLLPWLLHWFFPDNFAGRFPVWPWVVSGLLITLALLAPMALQSIYLVWMKFGNIMHWLNSRIILGMLFYAIFLPMGLVMRLLGKDPMRRKLDSTLSSYRVVSEEQPKDNVERPY